MKGRPNTIIKKYHRQYICIGIKLRYYKYSSQRYKYNLITIYNTNLNIIQARKGEGKHSPKAKHGANSKGTPMALTRKHMEENAGGVKRTRC